jgi:hypothetical protein
MRGMGHTSKRDCVRVVVGRVDRDERKSRRAKERAGRRALPLTRQDALCCCRLRECDHIADRGGARQQHGEPVEAEGHAAMGGCAVFEAVEEVAELGLKGGQRGLWGEKGQRDDE